MDKFNFPTTNSERQPLLVDGATDNIPRLDPAYIAAAPVPLQALLTASAEAEAAMIRQALIYRRTIEEIVSVGSMSQVGGKLRAWERKLPGAFFMIQQDGNHISAATIRGDSLDLGGYRPAMYESLANKDSFPNGVNDTHTDHVSALLGIEAGTLVCETGAGLDTEKITRLNTTVKARGGHLLCHDTTPLLAKVARERMPEVPYIALPPFREFLGKALDQYSGRKVMTMKNTLTSMDQGDVDELIAVMKACKVEQLVVSQSVGPTMDLFTPKGQAILDHNINDIAFNTANECTIDLDSRNIIMVVMAERARQIAYTALLEILFQNLIDSASQNGYYVTSKTTSTGSTDLTETEAISFMKGKGIDCEISFKEGLFNEVSFTPTAILYTNNPNIPKGILRIHSTQIHITLSTKPSQTSAVSMLERRNHGLPIPALHTLRTTLLPDLNFNILKFDHDTDKETERSATYNGLAVLFDLFCAAMGTSIIKQYCGTQFERSLYESFGVTVDS